MSLMCLFTFSIHSYYTFFLFVFFFFTSFMKNLLLCSSNCLINFILPIAKTTMDWEDIMAMVLTVFEYQPVQGKSLG